MGFPAGRPDVILASRERLAVLLSFSQLSRSQQRLSVTAGNWLSQHRRQELYWKGNGFATGQKSYPPCVVSSPRGEVALPCQRARQPHSARQSSVASSARRRAPSAVGAFFLGPPSTSLFLFLGFPAGRPCVILTPRERLAVLLSFSQLSRSQQRQPVLPLNHHDFLPNGSRLVRRICMASPSPRRKVEVRFCWLLLAAAGCCYRPWCLAVPHAMSPGPPLLRQGYLTLDCPTQKFPPSAAAPQRMAGRFTRCWRGLANGTVPGVD